MRNLFLAFVLANLGFAAWHAWLARSEPSGRAASAAAGITLVDELDGRGASPGAPAGDLPEARPELRSESSPAAEQTATVSTVGPAGTESRATSSGRNEASAGSSAPRAAADAASKAPAAGEGASATASAPGPRCVSIGPFRALAQAATASAELRKVGYSPSQRAGEGDVWVGYWVYLDDLPSRAAANAAVAALHEKGVPDAYLIPGDTGDMISLGVFTDVARAGRLRDQVRTLGFEPVVVDRTRREDVYWVDVTLSAVQKLDLDVLQTPGKIARLEQHPCAAPSG